MSLPRAIHPGRRYLVTRRCSDRRFLMRPDDETNNAFVHCLPLAAHKTGVRVVGVGITSNHWHGVVVDRKGKLPLFLAHFHKLFAKHQNCLRGRWENFWAAEQTSVVELVEPDDVMAKLVYAIANPVSSHLVEKAHHWPGVECLSKIIKDVPLTATKPRRFFDPENEELPQKVELRLARAPGFERLDRGEYVKMLREKVEAAEAKAAQERAEKHILLVGRRALLRQHWNSRPNTREPRGGISPGVACRNKWARIEALQRNAEFICQHHAARLDLLAGKKAVFPAGTWWLRVYAGVRCADTPTRTPPKAAPPLLN